LADSPVLSDTSFTLAPPLLQTLARGPLADCATDKVGNIPRRDLSFILDTTAATISGRLAHDTGASGSDGLTDEPEVAGTATDANGIAKFSGALDRTAGPAVTSALQPDGSLTLTPALLNTLAGGALRDGAHTLPLVATDKTGKTSGLDLVGAVPGTSFALEMLEPSFHQDLNGDGVIGLAVMSGGTVEVSSAYSGPATFMGSSGILQLDQSASFSGTVAGMTGQDTLDLRDISFATIQSPTYSGTSTDGTLSVSDGTHNAKIALLGNYLASTFVASSDGHGGTNVVDPLGTPFHGGLDVTKYGVVGDGTTDNTQKLQSLISSSPNGTLFYFPAGTYLVSNTVHFSQSDFGIVGDLNPDGSPASILKSNTPNVTVADANYGTTSFGSFQTVIWLTYLPRA